MHSLLSERASVSGASVPPLAFVVSMGISTVLVNIVKQGVSGTLESDCALHISTINRTNF